jgi:hypothetical protein
MSRHYSYGALLRQRIVVAGLTLGLVTIMIGLFIELTVTSKKSTIDSSVQRLIEPLNPLLDLKTVQTLERYPIVTKEAIRSAITPKDVSGVGQIVPNETGETSAASSTSPAPSQAPAPSPSPEPSPEPEIPPGISAEDIIPE